MLHPLAPQPLSEPEWNPSIQGPKPHCCCHPPRTLSLLQASIEPRCLGAHLSAGLGSGVGVLGGGPSWAGGSLIGHSKLLPPVMKGGGSQLGGWCQGGDLDPPPSLKPHPTDAHTPFNRALAPGMVLALTPVGLGSLLPSPTPSPISPTPPFWPCLLLALPPYHVPEFGVSS